MRDSAGESEVFKWEMCCVLRLVRAEGELNGCGTGNRIYLNLTPLGCPWSVAVCTFKHAVD